jgi:hypothetical protein
VLLVVGHFMALVGIFVEKGGFIAALVVILAVLVVSLVKYVGILWS